MTELVWDLPGEHFYETGVDHGVLFPYDASSYQTGVPWNGLMSVTESPSGAEANSIYADNIKYLNLISSEEFGGTIEAYTYPEEFAECDGTNIPTAGVSVMQQTRKMFGLAYRTRIGNDVVADDLGYKLHLVWGALASPAEKAYSSVNETPEALTFSWTFTTTKVAVPVAGLKPTALIVIDSTKVAPADLSDLEDAIYGTSGTDSYLPTPDAVIAMFDGSTPTEVTPTEPSFVAATGVITIPSVTGVEYFRVDTGAVVAAGDVTITTPGDSLLIRARPEDAGYVFPDWADNDWSFTRDP